MDRCGPFAADDSRPGGLLKLEDMALAHPGWHFDGVDPSQPMLDLAAQRLHRAGVPGDRVALNHDFVPSAPAGPFDGATCLLTCHFVPSQERVPLLKEIRQRLKPGAPLVVAHLSAADGECADGPQRGRGERSVAVALCRVSGGVWCGSRARDKVTAELAV